MTRISNVDHVLLLLRERLQRLDGNTQAKADRAASAKRTDAGSPRSLTDALDRIRALDPDEAGRALVMAVLTEKFGEEVVNDASFQTIITKVNDILATDTQLSELLRKSVEGLKNGD
jgi:hypothetical protein